MKEKRKWLRRRERTLEEETRKQVKRSHDKIKVDGQYVVDRTQMAEEIRKFAADRYPDTDNNDRTQMTRLRKLEKTAESAEHTPTIRMDLLYRARASMQGGKAPSFDDVTVEMLKALPYTAMAIVKRAFQQRMEGVSCDRVEWWQHLALICLAKKTVRHWTSGGLWL